nr:uncharacterized protein LOC116650950 [Drosophila virilis]
MSSAAYPNMPSETRSNCIVGKLELEPAQDVDAFSTCAWLHRVEGGGVARSFGFLTFVSQSPLNNIYAIYWQNRSALTKARLLLSNRWSLVVLSGSDAIPNAKQRGLQFWFCCCCCCDFYGGMCQAAEQLSAKLLLIVLKYKNKRIKQNYVVAHTKMSTSN